MELKKQATKGAIWAFMDQFGVQLVAFLVNLVLARLLMPADFGTIALFNVFISISSVLINGGLSSSLIRSKSLDNSDLSTVFWFNIGMTVVLYILTFALAPFIAAFYEMPILTSIIRVYGIVLVIDSFIGVQSVLFEKKLDFKTTFKVRLPSVIIGGISGICLAFMGMGVWSLVYSVLIQNFLYTFQYWCYSDWRPTFEFDMQKFKYHFAFGSRMTLSALLNVIFDNIYGIVIGKQFSETALGFYNRAESFKNLPITNVSNALNRVTYPLFAQFSDDNEKLRNAYQQLLKVVIFIVAPLICIMVIAADPAIRFLLGEKWLPIVPYFQIMSIGALFQPIHSYNLNLLHVKGRSDLYLRLEIIKKVLIVIAVVVGLRFGMYGLVWAQVVVSVFSLFINTYYTARFINYSMGQQLIDLLPSMLISCAIAGAVWAAATRLPVQMSAWANACMIIGSYLVLFWAICIVFKVKEYGVLKSLMRGVIAKKN